MSESISTAYDDTVDERAQENGRSPAETSGAILFPQLVWAHYHLQEEAGHLPARHRDGHGAGSNGGKGRSDHDRGLRAAERTFRAKLAEFQGAEGEILDAYWCWSEASAVALTAKPPPRTQKRRGPELRLHRVTDWATLEAPEIAELLHHYDALAIKASEILTPSPKRIAMERIFAEQSYLLGYVETLRESTKATLKPLVDRQRAALKQVEDYYDRAAQNAARIYYFIGMVLGLVAVLCAAAVVAVPLIVWAGVDVHSMRDYLAAYAAGAIGACVSVMSRMRLQGGFRVDYEVGRLPLYVLGGVRPAVGAIFGTATFFALQSNFIQGGQTGSFYFFALLAFLSGFSERFTHVIFGQAEKTVTNTIEAEEKQEADASSARTAGTDSA